MSDIFSNYTFEFSVPGDPDHDLPSGYFSTLPFRTSKFKDNWNKASAEMLDKCTRLLNVNSIDPFRVGAETHRGHVLSWYMPELPREVGEEMAGMMNVVSVWDDITDTMSHELHDAAMDDMMLGLLERKKLGKPQQCEMPINQAILDLVFGARFVAGKERDLENVLLDAAPTQPVPTLDMSFEEYKTLRAKSSGAGISQLLLEVGHGISISQEERDSVQPFLNNNGLIVGLVNDLFGFHKEFDELSQAGSLDMLHNAVALLMQGYGYSEDEATHIIQQEILAAEKEVMDGYQAWEQSNSIKKSDELRKYVVSTILGLGGAVYWHTHSRRYSRPDLTATAEDRAQLVAKDPKNIRRLKGYPPPAAFAHCTSLPREDFHLSQPQNGVKTNGVNGKKEECPGHALVNGHSKPNLFAPFKYITSEDICMSPYEYTASQPGKNTLVKFVDALQPWLQVPPEALGVIKDASVMLFNTTLMIDDIQDGSLLRRGNPAAHVVFGKSQTINSANYLYVKLAKHCDQLKGKASRRMFLDGIETLSLGQGLELHWRFRGICPSVDDYLSMIDHKTGGFFRVVTRLMLAESGAGGEADPDSDPELLEFITLLGRCYQIRDDYKNLVSDEYTSKKGFCDDLREGKFSLPLIHFLKQSQSASANLVWDVLRNRSGSVSPDSQQLSDQMITWILTQFKEAGSLEYVSDVLEQLFQGLLDTLDRLEEKRGRNRKLRILVLWLK